MWFHRTTSKVRPAGNLPILCSEKLDRPNHIFQDMQLSLMQLIRAESDRLKTVRPLTVPSANFLRCSEATHLSAKAAFIRDQQGCQDRHSAVFSRIAYESGVAGEDASYTGIGLLN